MAADNKPTEFHFKVNTCERKKTQNQQHDTYLVEAKRESQDRSRKLVRDGVRTQESMFFFSPEIVKELKVRHRA